MSGTNSSSPSNSSGSSSSSGASGPASLAISQLRASIGGKEILAGVDLIVRPGEVHAIMGPNGSGKSTLAHVMMGRPGYVDVTGSVRLNGLELLGLPTSQRAQAGLFLGMQYPTEVPGVHMTDVLREVLRATAGDVVGVEQAIAVEAERIGLDASLLTRALNVDLSGGEKKRNETVQLGVLHPRFAILDEVDSGLDVDALRAVSKRVLDAVRDDGMGVVAITHYNRLLAELTADVVHVFARGRIVASGGPELALELEKTGYEPYLAKMGLDDRSVRKASVDPLADLFA
jgi:Fe-S cluster assembly ATP-binding protein